MEIINVRNKHRTIIVSFIGGKYFVTVDGKLTQKNLNSEDVMRYLGNVLEDGS